MFLLYASWVLCAIVTFVMILQYSDSLWVFVLFLTITSQLVDFFWSEEGLIARQSLYLRAELVSLHALRLMEPEPSRMLSLLCMWHVLLFIAVLLLRHRFVEADEDSVKVAEVVEIDFDLEEVQRRSVPVADIENCATRSN